MIGPAPVLLIGCGALAREIKWAIDKNNWRHMELTCLPADLHNRPQHIPDAIRTKIRSAKATGKYSDIFAVYGDCGTGGLLDKVLDEEGVARIGGTHCYEFYAGSAVFEAMAEEELGSLYLTDYLVRFFDRLIIKGLGLDRFPHLRDDYFGHYKRVVYLSQKADDGLIEQARAAARRLDLEFVHRPTGIGGIEMFLRSFPVRASEEGSERVLQEA